MTNTRQAKEAKEKLSLTCLNEIIYSLELLNSFLCSVQISFTKWNEHTKSHKIYVKTFRKLELNENLLTTFPMSNSHASYKQGSFSFKDWI